MKSLFFRYLGLTTEKTKTRILLHYYYYYIIIIIIIIIIVLFITIKN